VRIRPSNLTALFLFTALVALGPGNLAAQQAGQNADSERITVLGSMPADISGLPEGPEVKGIIAARGPNALRVAGSEGSDTLVGLSTATQIRGSGGFLGLERTDLAPSSLLNGLPVSIETAQWEEGLIARRIKFKNEDLEIAAMIHGGTAQRFAQHDAAIQENAQATEALRGRMGDIDKYNIKSTTNVYFETGKWDLSPSAKQDLCAVAGQAQATENALLLVVGYTDSVGSEEYNQVLSERRAGRVVNYLQQECRWAPYRMLTPTGMAEADPMADNDTANGKAQNRRVSVNILVSKAVDGG
jgi:OOP family OmpA-OmpF porin